MLFNIHHDERLIHRESARERQKKDNAAKNALHHKTLGCSSLRQKILPLTSEIKQSLVQVVLRDRLALKSLSSVTEKRYILQRHKRRTRLQS